MTLDQKALEAAIRADQWPANLHAIVDAVNAASDDNDLSTEQCVALGIILASRSSAIVEEPMAGWKLVPVEATVAMQNAAIDVDSFKLGDISPIGFRISPQMLFEKCYRAMLAAAPPSPQPHTGRAAWPGEREQARLSNLANALFANREGTAAAHEHADEIRAEIKPHLEALGLTDEGDSWGFSTESLEAIYGPATGRAGVTDAQVEAAARAITTSRGVDPDTLFQINIFTGDEPFDKEDDRGRRFTWAWRKNTDAARAALNAALTVEPVAGEVTRAAAFEECAKIADAFAREIEDTESSVDATILSAANIGATKTAKHIAKAIRSAVAP